MEQSAKERISGVLLLLVCVIGCSTLILSFFITDPWGRGAAHSFVRLAAISCIVFFLMLWGLRSTSYSVRIPAFVFSLIIFSGMAYAAGLRKGVTFSAREQIQWYMITSGFILVLCRIVTADRYKWLILAVVLTGGAVLGIYGIDQAVYQFDNLSILFQGRKAELLTGLSPALAQAYEARVSSREVFATFFHPNTYGGLMGALSILALACFGEWFSRTRRGGGMVLLCCAAGTCAVVCGTGLFLSKAKGAWAAAGAALVFLFCIHSSVSKRRKVALLVLATAVCAVLFQCTSIFDASYTVRKGYWEGACGIIRDHPFAGIGPGNFGAYYTQYKPLYATEVQNPHNIYLRYWSETGILTLLVFCASMSLIFISGKKKEDEEDIIPCSGRMCSAWVLYGISAVFSAILLTCVFGAWKECSSYTVCAVIAVFVISIPLLRSAEHFDFSSFRLVRNGLYASLFFLLLHSCIDFDMAVPAVFLLFGAIASVAASGTPGIRITGRTGIVVVLICIPAVCCMYAFWGLRNAECRTQEAEIRHIMGSNPEHLETALELCGKGRRIFPRHDSFYVLEVEICRRLGPEYAVRMSDIQLELARLHRVKASDWFHLARMHEERGELKHAVRYYRKSTEFYPYNPRYWAFLSRGLRRRGYASESQACGRRALALDSLVRDPNVRLTPKEKDFLR